MGTEFYLVDKNKNEVFELGKHISPYKTMENISILLSDEYAFKFFVIKDIAHWSGHQEVSYSVEIANSLWDFVKGRKSWDLELMTDGTLCDNKYEFGILYKYVGTRYYLGDKEKNQECLDEMNKSAEETHQAWLKRNKKNEF